MTQDQEYLEIKKMYLDMNLDATKMYESLKDFITHLNENIEFLNYGLEIRIKITKEILNQAISSNTLNDLWLWMLKEKAEIITQELEEHIKQVQAKASEENKNGLL